MDTLIKNCRLVSPGIDTAGTSILIRDGKIFATGADAQAAGAKIINAEGLTAVPGFIDVHCHGRNNYDFCDAKKEGVECIAANKLKEGVTTLLPTTLTLAEEALADTLSTVAAYSGKGCRIPGVHLEGPFINPKCTGAQNPAFVRNPDVNEVLRLDKICKVRKVSFAVEQPGGTELTMALLRRGIVPSCVHSAANYAQFKSAYDRGLRNLSHFCNQMTPLHHRDIGLVGAGLMHKDVFAEFICDKLHVSPDMIKLTFQVKGAERIILISDAMRASGMPDGDYTLGGLPVAVADGAARLKEGGALAGSTLQLNTALKNITGITGLPLSETVKASGWNAARSLGLTGYGKLEPGYTADIVLLDENYQVMKTLIGGEVRYGK